MSKLFEKLKGALGGSGQEHVLDFWEELSEEEKESLGKQILEIPNYKHLNLVLRESVSLLDDNKNESFSVDPPPATSIFCPHNAENKLKLAEYERAGFDGIVKGKVAVLLMAGGSGTRLGVSIPKGMFTCPLLKQQKSLFQFHSERILKVEQLAHNVNSKGSADHIPFVIMTSEQNHSQTTAFFKENNFFGLQKNQVHFFIQTSLPCYDEKNGKILMESKSAMCVAPGGNGGVYQSLASSGILAALKQQGVELIQIFGVDNLLAAVADPVFLGYTMVEKKSVAVKTTPKVSAHERVGVFALVNRKWGVVEYTEIGVARAEELDPVTKELKFNCGNIATHICSMDFLSFAAKKMESETRFHAARKTISTMNGVVPAVKLEAFIFDMFAYCNEVNPSSKTDGFGIVQVDRSEEFAPIKNADTAPSDNPATAAVLLHELHTKWAKKVLQADSFSQTALARLEEANVKVEFSPLISYKGEGLEILRGELVARISTAAPGDIICLDNAVAIHSKC